MLTEQQEKFLALIFLPEYANSMEQAKVDAGYSPDSSLTRLLESVKEEIIKRADTELAKRIVKSLNGIDKVLDNPEMKGAKALLEAAAMIMDRAGVTKKERLEVEHKGASGVFILPEKKPNQ